MHKKYEDHLNPVMLVFIEKALAENYQMSSICIGFNHFSVFCHHIMLIKLATNSEKVNTLKVETGRYVNIHRT